jgi:hypothetical protein
MILRVINSLLALITRPYFYAEKYFLGIFQSFLPTHFDEQSWYILFGFMTFLVFIIAYMLSRCVTLKDADDDPVYQRARLYSIQRQHRKVN